MYRYFINVYHGVTHCRCLLLRDIVLVIARKLDTYMVYIIIIDGTLYPTGGYIF